jgi:hypothetical protein
MRRQLSVVSTHVRTGARVMITEAAARATSRPWMSASFASRAGFPRAVVSAATRSKWLHAYHLGVPRAGS